MTDYDPTPIDLDAHDRAAADLRPFGPLRSPRTSDMLLCRVGARRPHDEEFAQVLVGGGDGDRPRHAIATIVNDHAAMVAELRTARARIAELEAAHHAICDELGVGFIAEDAHAAARKLKALAGVGPLGGGIDEAVAARVAQLVAAVDAACDALDRLAADYQQRAVRAGEPSGILLRADPDALRQIAHPPIAPVTP